MVDRPRIRQALEGSVDTRLTLVAAPAGYGKTTAVRGWCESRGGALAWVTLDELDNDPVRLWSYVATAVDRVRQGLGRGALQRLGVSGSPIEAAVDELMNGVDAFASPIVIVLDDLHTVTEPECLASIDYALERLPGNAPHGREHARGSRVAARAAAGRGRARGGTRERAGVHPRGGQIAPRRAWSRRTRPGGARTAGRAHRGVAGRAGARGALASCRRQPRSRRAGLRGGPALRRGLPEPRGLRVTRRRAALVPTGGLGPRTVHLGALRRRARPLRLGDHAGRARAHEHVGPAARAKRLVPSPLAVRRVRGSGARVAGSRCEGRGSTGGRQGGSDRGAFRPRRRSTLRRPATTSSSRSCSSSTTCL